jgi:gluconokinase
MIIILMGVSGCGKTTNARALADKLNIRFVEGDALHPPDNVAKMSTGTPLTQCDREPWLEAVRIEADKMHEAGEDVIVTCSALSKASRKTLATDRPHLELIHLTAPKALLAERLAQRKDHYLPPQLLQSQLDSLEAPTSSEALEVSVDQPVDSVMKTIIQHLQNQQRKHNSL